MLLGKDGARHLGDLSEWRKEAGPLTMYYLWITDYAPGPHGVLASLQPCSHSHAHSWLSRLLSPSPSHPNCITAAIFPISSLGSSRLASVCLLIH